MKTKREQAKKLGRKPKRLKAEGVDWKDALKHALRKPKSGENWPKK
jgi:hypothetical protein